MNMTEVKCRNCGAPMEYVTGIRHLQCKSCGSEFVLEGNNGLAPIFYNGGVLFQAYIPEGWNYDVFSDLEDVSKDEYTCFGIRAWSEDANLFFYPRAYYKDCNSLGYQLVPPMMIKMHKYLPIDEYVSQRILEMFPQAQNVSARRLDDAVFEKKASDFLLEAGRKLPDIVCSHGKYEVSFSLNGQMMHGLFGTILCHRGAEVSAQAAGGAPQSADNGQGTAAMQGADNGQGTTAMQGADNGQGTAAPQEEAPVKMDFNFFMRGGILGAMKRGEKLPGFGNQAASVLGDGLAALKNIGQKIGGGHNWGRAFDAVLVTPAEKLYLYDGIFNDFALNVNYGPQYTALQEQERANVENIMVQGQMRQQQIQMDGARRVSQSIAQRNDIIMSGYAERTARMDHMQQMYTEANRGVNTYTDNYGQKVEASVRYDHVYQKGTDYVGSDVNLNLGPDWQELKRDL